VDPKPFRDNGTDRADPSHGQGQPIYIDSVQRTPRRVGIAASVGTVGDSYDALAETINGLFKTELIKPRGPWRTPDHVEVATAEWIDWFNYRRVYRYCGDVPPAELEEAYFVQHRAQPTAELSHH